MSLLAASTTTMEFQVVAPKYRSVYCTFVLSPFIPPSNLANNKVTWTVWMSFVGLEPPFRSFRDFHQRFAQEVASR